MSSNLGVNYTYIIKDFRSSWRQYNISVFLLKKKHIYLFIIRRPKRGLDIVSVVRFLYIFNILILKSN